MDDEQMKESFSGKASPTLIESLLQFRWAVILLVAKTKFDMRGFDFGTFLFPRPKTEKVFFVDIHLERCLDSRKGKREKTATKLRTSQSNPQKTSL